MLLQLTPGQTAVIVALLLVGLLVKALVLWWLYLDTTQRGQPPLWWLVAAAVFDIPTLIVWLIMRPPQVHANGTTTGQEPRQTPGREPVDAEASNGGPGAELAPPPQPAPAASGTLLRVTCPHCATQFRVTKQPGPQDVQCPSCERTGTLPATV